MAKKKSNGAANAYATQPKEQHQKVRMQEDRAEQPALPPKDAAAEEATEKVRNLKALNAVLVKQAHELRVERSSLMSVSGELKVENEMLKVGKAELEDVEVRLGLEKEVVAVVVGRGVEEMRRCGFELVEVVRELERKVEVVEREVDGLWSEKESAARAMKELGEYSLDVEKERDGLKVEVEARSGEVNALKAKVDEILDRENEIVQALQKLKIDYEAVVRAKMEKDVTIENLKNERDSMKLSLDQSLACSESLKDEIGSLSMEKQFVEMERNEKLMVIDQLEKEMFSLRETVLVLQTEVERLRETVSEIDKCNAELTQQKEGLLMEFGVLKNQNKEKEEQIGKLLLEKAMLTETVDKSASDLAKTVKEAEKVEALLQAEIIELREASKRELGEMEEVVHQLKNKLEWTQQCYETEIEEKMKLTSELEQLRKEMEAVVADNVCARKDIQLEKKNVESLTQKAVEMENRMQESAKEIQRLKFEISKLNEAEASAQSQVELLKKENGFVHKKLEEAEEHINKEKTNSESASVASDIVLRMLKKTASQLHESGDMLGEVEQLPTLQSDGVKPFVSEMEAIKNAFQSREMMMADMKKQLEMMKHSVAEAEKGKSVWKLVSSATTIFAAASLAYVSRGH